jgi:hypothetical protein
MAKFLIIVLVNKYAALLLYYQSKYPVEKSVLLLEAEKVCVS